MPMQPSSTQPTVPARAAARATPFWRSGYELLSSMRFAIVLLTIISIASVVGTVLRQQEPLVNYVDAFGPFWAELFLTLQLNAVYSAWWFVLILAFLVLSTSLCIARNAPKYLADMRRFQEHLRIGSLRAMPFRAEASLNETASAQANRIAHLLTHQGWRVRLQERGGTGHAPGWLVAAKKGAANKLGYIATHGAIVMICLGGLVDGNLLVRAQTWLGGKAPFTGSGMLADVPERHRLPANNPSFRGNLLINEGTRSGTAIVNASDGILLQELPFLIELIRFDVEYYSTGMPRVFASDVVIHDRATGAATPHRIEVNHPLRVHGIDIFQSGFDDGGSRVAVQPVGLLRPLPSHTEPLEATVGGSVALRGELARAGHTLELAELRVLNVENLSNAVRGGGVDVRRVDLRSSIEARLGAGHKTATPQDLRNVGPSITYRLRDGAGQATEFHNYMLAVDLGDGVPVYLLGMRRALADEFSYLRLPQDQEGSMQSFLGLLHGLNDATERRRAVDRYVDQVVDPHRPDLRAQLHASAARTIELFAGALEAPATPDTTATAGHAAPTAGLVALSRFMEDNIPSGEMERATEVLLRILNGVLFELLQQTRADAGLPALDPADPATQDFMRVALFSLSDAYFYPEPVVYLLDDFTQVQASVFQVAKAPGRYIVYLGCLLLIIGIFLMLYVRDRRLWVWLAPIADSDRAAATLQAQMAMSTNRRTLDTAREFDQLSQLLLGTQPPPTATPEPPR